MPEIKQALKQYSDRGVNRIKIEFSGGGDSGMINGITYFMGDKNVTADFVYQWKWDNTQQKRVLEGTIKYELEPIGKEKRTPEAVIEQFAYENSGQADWWNNEGGCGEFVFTYDNETEAWAYELEIHIYVTETELAHSRSEVIE